MLNFVKLTLRILGTSHCVFWGFVVLAVQYVKKLLVTLCISIVVGVELCLSAML